MLRRYVRILFRSQIQFASSLSAYTLESTPELSKIFGPASKCSLSQSVFQALVQTRGWRSMMKRCNSFVPIRRSVQRTPLRPTDYRFVRELVHELQAELAGSGDHDGGSGDLRDPYHNPALGSAPPSRVRKALAALRSARRQLVEGDETYIKVHGQWVYLYRAVDKAGQTVDKASGAAVILRRWHSHEEPAPGARSAGAYSATGLRCYAEKVLVEERGP
jgi:hypothetical protein